MAKRRNGRKSPTRRRKQGISLINTAEAVALASAATQTLFNVNAFEFVMGNSKGFTAAGANAISLRELFNPTQQTGRIGLPTGGSVATSASTMAIVQQNLSNNWLEGSLKMVTIPLAFRFGKAVGKPAINKINAVLRKANIASTVRL